MAANKGLFGIGTPATVVVAGVLAVILGLLGREAYLRNYFGQSEVETPSAQRPAAQPQPQETPSAAENEQTAETETEAVEQEDAAPETPEAATEVVLDDGTVLQAPRIDVVRVETDGRALIAGSGTSGSLVQLLIDDQPREQASVDAGGKFVIFASLPPSNQPRLLTMVAKLADHEVFSEDQIILAPTQAAVAAEVEPEETTVGADTGGEATEEATAAGDGTQAVSTAVTSEVTDALEEAVAGGEVAETAADATDRMTAQADKPSALEEVGEEIAENAEPVDAEQQAPDAETASVAATTGAVGTEQATGTETDSVTTATVAGENSAAATEAEMAAKEVEEPASQGPVSVADASDPEEPEAPATASQTAPDVPEAEDAAPTEVVAAAEPGSPAAPAEAPETSQEPAPQPDAVETPDAPAEPETVGTASSIEGPDTTAPTQPATPVAVAVLRASADGVELIQPGIPERPEAMDSIALDTISYSEKGEVQLSGRSADGSTVRVYLDNEPVVDLDVNDEGRWKGELTGVEPGVYTLRLDELGEGGDVESRIETPFKREAPEILQAARADRPPESPPISAVTVQKGDTLWAISQERYGRGVLYVRVFEANRQHIRDPDLIYPGQVFAIPD